VRLRTSPAWNR
jgi:class 3 adenylate cyclase